MKKSSAASVAGEQLKALRLQLGMTTREVEGLSRRMAEAKDNQEFHISHAWLTNIENGHYTPSIFKLYSLSAIYRYNISDLLGFFGLHLEEMTKDLLSVRLPATHLLGKATDIEGEAITLPTRFSDEFQVEKTCLLSPMIKNWHKIPVSMISHLNFEDALYGYIGLEDFTLYPLIRPGSFVEIDARQNRIKSGPAGLEFERPIYFVELRGSYICCWCQLDGDQLMTIPHPHSRQAIRRFKYPSEAEIVGRVTAVTMRLVDIQPKNP